MIKNFKLTPSQWKLLASAFSNIGQAVILFSFASYFVPETVDLSRDFSKSFSSWVLIGGLLLIFGML